VDQPKSRSELCSSSLRVQVDPLSLGHKESGRPREFERVRDKALRLGAVECRRVSLRVGRKRASPGGAEIVPSMGTGRGRSGRNRSHPS